jgi:hypothetical protein
MAEKQLHHGQGGVVHHLEARVAADRDRPRRDGHRLRHIDRLRRAGRHGAGAGKGKEGKKLAADHSGDLPGRGWCIDTWTLCNECHTRKPLAGLSPGVKT